MSKLLAIFREVKVPRTMKSITFSALLLGLFMAAGIIIFNHDDTVSEFSSVKKKKYTREQKNAFTRARWLYEYNLLKDPGTGRIPAGIRAQEFAIARTIPSRHDRIGSGVQGVENLNNYTAAGPDSIGGRTRALAYDLRYNNTTNRVIISGSVSGGIFRSTDGGANWTRVNPEEDVHNLTSLAQDPRPGFQDTWYAGGGEAVGNSASEDGAPYLSIGIWKSVNNGASWVKLPLQVADINGSVLGGGTLEVFDNPFDFVHRIVVNPVNGDVYIAGHRRLVRSTNGGAAWNVVFSGVLPAGSGTGQMDIACTNAGRLILAINGGFPDVNLRGVWTSTTGNANTWTRIAGGSVLGVDSVSNWRASSGSGVSRRILLALAPSNQNIVYVCYENGLSQDGANPVPEADLYHLDMTGGTNVWSNRSANMPDFPGQADGVDPLELQGGYNLSIHVKPDDPNVVFVGGTNLFRSTDGFSTKTTTAWIGGYNQNFSSGLQIYPRSHPDFHNLAFMPNNNNINPGFLRAMAANDGGLQSTENIMATAAVDPVVWTMIRNYQTVQYFHVGIDPEPNSSAANRNHNNFIGGAQDNGTQVRVSGSNNHFRIISGDGGAASIAYFRNSGFLFYGTAQLGTLYRDLSNEFDEITPTGLTSGSGSDGFGDFVTYFKMDFDNSEDLYYANFNRLFRTTSGSTVTSNGWTELTGVASTVNTQNPNGSEISIRAMELSRGEYFPTHALYIGTSNGQLYRLNNPRNAAANTEPVDITPPVLKTLLTQGTAVNINDIAVNPNNDDEVMLVVSNYSVTQGSTVKTDFNIWWTNNAKSTSPTWRLAEGNLALPSIRSCMIVNKREGANSVTEYYVGTSVGLYSMVNLGGALLNNQPVNWVREGGNVLNYSVITSLDYRPQDNVLLVGTHGNGLYFAEIGSPDFRPNQNTPVTEPIRNDKNFITLSFPTIVKNTISYRIGNMFTIRRMSVTLTTLSGQTVVRKEVNYSDGQLDIAPVSKGTYILSITSEDGKQQYIRKIFKD